MERSDGSTPPRRHDDRSWTHPSEFGTFDGARREPPATLGRGLLAASALVGGVVGLTTVWLVVPTGVEAPASAVRAVTITTVLTPSFAPTTSLDPPAPVATSEPAPAPTEADGDTPTDTSSTFTGPAPDEAVDQAGGDESGGAGDSGDDPAAPQTAPTTTILVDDAAGTPPDGLAWVGMSIGALDGAVEVVAVHDDSPASRAGFVAGHRIVAVDGRPVRSVGALIGYLVTCRPGDTVTFEVLAGRDTTTTVGDEPLDPAMSTSISVELGAIEPSV